MEVWLFSVYFFCSIWYTFVFGLAAILPRFGGGHLVAFDLFWVNFLTVLFGYF